MKHTISDLYKRSWRLESVSRIQRFPTGRIAGRCKAAVQEDWQSVGRVHKPLLHGTRGVDQGCHIPVGILHSVTAFIERAVTVRVTVTENDVINVPQSPHELSIGTG